MMYFNVENKALFREQSPLIIDKVKRQGDISDIETWRKAFPQIEFLDVDYGMTGEKIDWDSYSPTEKAAYVAYMKDPQNSAMEYYLSILGDTEQTLIDDSEIIWFFWFYHVFQYFDDEENLNDKALRELVHQATLGKWQEILFELAIHEEGADIESMKFAHEPVITQDIN